ncbi:MAG: Gfo/Idh/MocA family protein, partial [Dehalococcoidia bacterium]
NVHRGWAPRSHLPAIVASPEFELTAVCTTRRESAEESAKMFGARLAFSDYREMLAHPEIDAVSVVLRVPSHYQVTMDALNAGKHVYTEWPLGKTLAEAQEMADLARSKGVRCMVGLQARANPAIMYMKDLVESGYVGEIMACRVSILRDGVLQRTSDRTWQRDDSLGATTFTIAFGHTVDALRYVVGDFSQVSSVVATQANQWYETDTQQHVDVTAPDNVLLSGKLANGAVASVHVAAVPWVGSEYKMEVFGREGTLVASSDNTPQLEKVALQGATGGARKLEDLPVPEKYTFVLEGMPQGEAYNVGQMYYQFGQAIRAGQTCEPSFDTAVELHQFLESVRAASDQGQAMAAPAS